MADVTTTTRIGMALDEFIRLNEEQPFELINGERRPKLPNVAGHSKVIRTLFIALYQYAAARQEGEVYNETTFVLPAADETNWVEGSRIPDVMFYTGDRLAVYEAATPDWRSRPFALVPDFVAEVISPGDKFSELDEKIDAYLLDGVRLIWALDPQRRKAVVYAPDAEQPRHLAGDAVLDGGDVLPGFQVVLSKLFE
jgi:Uma2 family endonuclease